MINQSCAGNFGAMKGRIPGKRISGLFFSAAALALLWGPGAARCGAAQLVINSSAVSSILKEHVFVKNGRKYLYESSDPCAYAYLRDPVVSIGGGRVRVRALFVGSLARDVMGNCLGFSDQFPVSMDGVPFYRGGVIGLDDVRVSGLSGNEAFDAYPRPFLEKELRSALQRNLREEVDKRIAQKAESAPYEIPVTDLDVPSIVAEDERLVLTGPGPVRVRFPSPEWTTQADSGPLDIQEASGDNG